MESHFYYNHSHVILQLLLLLLLVYIEIIKSHQFTYRWSFNLLTNQPTSPKCKYNILNTTTVYQYVTNKSFIKCNPAHENILVILFLAKNAYYMSENVTYIKHRGKKVDFPQCLPHCSQCMCSCQQRVSWHVEGLTFGSSWLHQRLCFAKAIHPVSMNQIEKVIQSSVSQSATHTTQYIWKGKWGKNSPCLVFSPVCLSRQIMATQN